MRIKKHEEKPKKAPTPLKQPVEGELHRDPALLPKPTAQRSLALAISLGIAAVVVVAGLVYEMMQPAPEPHIVRPELDADMTAAIASARADFDTFVEHYRNPSDEQTYIAVKAPYLHGRYLKYVWLREIDLDGDTLRGRLEQDELARNVEVSRDEIIDWMVIEGTTLIGGYTTRVDWSRKTAEERAELEKRFGFTLPDLANVDTP